MNDTTYCDHCGEGIPEGHGCFFGAITVPVASANVGESASLCEKCFTSLGVASCGSCTAMLPPDWNGGSCPECATDIDKSGEVWYIARCPACGDVIDYCQGHGEMGDPAGRAILDAHDDGDHSECHPDGCEEAPERRLEYLRQEIRAERISYAELAELADLAPFIDERDVELLEWAGVPEKEVSR